MKFVLHRFIFFAHIYVMCLKQIWNTYTFYHNEKLNNIVPTKCNSMYCECTPSRASQKDLSFMWSLFRKVIAINIWCAKTSFGINTTCFVHLKNVLKTILHRFYECPLGCTTWDTIMLCRIKNPPPPPPSPMKGIWNPYIYISAYLTQKTQRSI
jgi:hypothetical protein